MRKLFFFTAFSITAFLLSTCKKEPSTQTCGDEGFAACVAQSYKMFNTPFGPPDNGVYHSYVTLEGKTRVFTMETTAFGICNQDKPNIHCDAAWKLNDTAVHWAAYVYDGGHGNSGSFLSTNIPMTGNWSFTQGNLDYNLANNWGSKDATITAGNQCRFKTLGSFAADSAYFANNLDEMKVNINFHKPK